MHNYALVIDGVFKEVRQYQTKPDDIPHKSVKWLPFETEIIAQNKTPYLTTVSEIVVLDDRVVKRNIVSDLPIEQRRKYMECSPYQARVALLQAGLLDTVQNTIDALPTDAPARIAWEYATVIRRDSEFINAVGTMLNLSDEQIDNLFNDARQIA